MKRRSSLGLAFLMAVSAVVVSASPALAAGDITGNVTDELSLLPIVGICVEAHDAITEGTIVGFDETDVNGDYSIAGLPDGDYKLYFYDPGTCGTQTEAGSPVWFDEWGNNAAGHASATPVTIAGANQARDAVLTGTSMVDGTPNGGTLNCVTVSLWDADAMAQLGTPTTGSAYSFSGLTTGVNYTLKFKSSGAGACLDLAGEWHGGIPVSVTVPISAARYGDAADTFTVGAGATVTIDPTLEMAVTITGTMISERTGDPIEGATLRLYPLGSGGGPSSDWIEVDSGASGVFTWDAAEDLAVANSHGYKIQAENYNDIAGLHWDLEWWQDADNIAPATPLDTSSAAGGTVDLGASLDRHGPGSIVGTVTEEGSGVPIEGVAVNLYDDAGTVALATDTTDVNGMYDLGEMNAADYDVEFLAAGYVTEWNADDPDSTSGATAVVASDEGDLAATTLNAVLTISDDGAISGTVTDDFSGDPLAGATVTLYTAAGALVDSTTTAGDGTYALWEVVAAEYDIEFTAVGYVSEWYDNAGNSSVGSVTVAVREAVVADVTLTPDLGSISGTLSVLGDTLGGQFAGVTVEVYSGGTLVGSDAAAGNGTFTVGGLVAGTYTVLASTGPAENPDTYFSAWYVAAPLFVTDDASDVVVGVGVDVTGIDIALQPLFVDVLATNQFYADIVWMQESGITLGCQIDAYCPADSVTRGQMATFLVRALGLAPDATDYFTDDDTNLHEANINALRGAGITLGCDVDVFCPNDTVSRAQMASFIVRAMGYEISTVDYFTDDDGNAHEDNINTLRENNVTLGCDVDSYCPNDDVRRDHMAAFLHRALGD